MSTAESIFDKNIESIFSKLFRIKKAKINHPGVPAQQTSSILDTKKEVVIYAKENKVEGGVVYIEEETIVKGSNEKDDTSEITVYIY